MVLAWQLAFPLFAWRPKWGRVLLLGGAAIYWGGVYFLFKLPEFGPFVFLASLSFLSPEEWAWLKEHVQSSLGGSVAGRSTAVPRQAVVSTGIQSLKTKR